MSTDRADIDRILDGAPADVASGSTGRAVLCSRLNGATTKKRSTARVASLCCGDFYWKSKCLFQSLSHSINIPAIVLKNINVMILNAISTFIPRAILVE